MTNLTIQDFAIGSIVVFVVVGGGLALGVKQKPSPPRIESIEQAELIIEQGIEDRFEGTRFDLYDAQVSQCTIHVHYHDNDACREPHTLQTYTDFVDLRVFEVQLRFTSPRPSAEGWRLTPDFEARPKVGDESRYIAEHSDELLDEARSEVGWGWQAAVLSSERLLSQYPFESLATWQRVTQCSGHSWVSPRSVRISLGGSDPSLLEAALQAYSESCSPQ